MGLGAGFLAAPDAALIRSAMGASHVFLPSPGVPEAHPAFAIAAELETPIASEFDLARWWDDRPIAAITGTDGKTTVTMLTVAMIHKLLLSRMTYQNQLLMLLHPMLAFRCCHT